MRSRGSLFHQNKTYLENLPAKLLTRLYVVGLINHKQVDLYSPDNSELHLTLTANGETALFPSSISITMITSYQADGKHRSDKLITKKYNYTFCKKNIADWSEVDENGKETSDNNPSAYVFEEYGLLQEQTEKCVQTIIKEIKKCELGASSLKEDDNCNCAIF